MVFWWTLPTPRLLDRLSSQARALRFKVHFRLDFWVIWSKLIDYFDKTKWNSKANASSATPKRLTTKISCWIHWKTLFTRQFITLGEFGWETKVNVQNRSEPSSSVLHCYHLTRGSTLTSQDYSPSSVVYVPEPIRNAFGLVVMTLSQCVLKQDGLLIVDM
jgi:hypothetical protein